MDCARVSTAEFKDVHAKGRYTIVPKITNIDDCKKQCVSDLRCNAWYYQSGNKTLFDKTKGQCWLSDTKNDEYEIKPNTLGGKVKCEKLPNYGYILMWIIISVIILFAVWYFLNVMEPIRFNLHERMVFPNIHFKGARE